MVGVWKSVVKKITLLSVFSLKNPASAQRLLQGWTGRVTVHQLSLKNLRRYLPSVSDSTELQSHRRRYILARTSCEILVWLSHLKSVKWANSIHCVCVNSMNCSNHRNCCKLLDVQVIVITDKSKKTPKRLSGGYYVYIYHQYADSTSADINSQLQHSHDSCLPSTAFHTTW